MDNNSTHNSAFDSLTPEKMNFIKNFMGQQTSNNANEMMALLMAFSSKAKNQGIEFSQTETDLLIEELKRNMNPADRRKTEFMLAMLRSRRNR